MKLGPTGKKAGRGGANPFEALRQANTQPAGAGVGVPREAPGLGLKGRKRQRPFAQALGDTPPRDGPFAASARPVYKQNPPKARVHQARRKSGGLDPYKAGGGV